MRSDVEHYIRDAMEDDPAYQRHIQFVDFERWLTDVRRWPQYYNFIHAGICKGHGDLVCDSGADHAPQDGRLNEYGRCEDCQRQLESAIEIAEALAGWPVPDHAENLAVPLDHDDAAERRIMRAELFEDQNERSGR